VKSLIWAEAAIEMAKTEDEWPQMNTDEPLMAGGPATLNDEKGRQLGQ
jgi:hypothetical protein